MPTQFLSMVWPLAFSIIFLAGLIVCMAATTMMIATITRSLHWKEKNDQESENVVATSYTNRRTSPRADPWSNQVQDVMETSSIDGIHYIPV